MCCESRHHHETIAPTSTRAFTLIEVMIALLILALLTGAAALSFVRPIRAAQAHQAIDQLRRADAMAREQARRTGRPVQLLFDLSTQMIKRDASAVQLPGNCTIRQIRIGERSIDVGEYALDISPLGLSRSYALNITGKDLNQWIVFAGLSGEVTTTSNASQVEQLLRQTSRRDAR